MVAYIIFLDILLYAFVNNLDNDLILLLKIDLVNSLVNGLPNGAVMVLSMVLSKDSLMGLPMLLPINAMVFLTLLSIV